jgi:hypothetical protein
MKEDADLKCPLCEESVQADQWHVCNKDYGRRYYVCGNGNRTLSLSQWFLQFWHKHIVDDFPYDDVEN